MIEVSLLMWLASGSGCDSSSEPWLDSDQSTRLVWVQSICGDGLVEGAELCDDGNAIDDDGCDASCSPSGVATMGAGDGTRCVVTHAGNVKCWGRNESGQLGQGHVQALGDDELPSEIDVIALGGLAEEVRTNGEQTFALLDSGVVRAWGQNAGFELGLGHAQLIGDDEVPAMANVATDVDLGGPVAQIEAGVGFACARRVDGAVRCWGANDRGQLGHGHTQAIGDDETPAQAGDLQLGLPAVSVAVGAEHACALLEGGLVRCWGANGQGQLGYGHTQDIGDDELPTSMPPVAVGGTVAEIVAGAHHTCARLHSGAVRCWGQGQLGRLGYGNTETIGDDELPEAAGDVPVGGTVVQLAAGWSHTCAVLIEGALRCWGSSQYGQLGYGDLEAVGDDEIPAVKGDVDLSGHPISALFVGPTASSTCVLLDDAALRCWGHNHCGQLGVGHTDPLGGEPGTEPGRIPDILVIDDSDN